MSEPTIFRASVLGDSHARFFFNNPAQLVRLGLQPSTLQIEGEAISAASLAGFRKKQSTLNAKARAREAAQTTERLVLAFGQVDLELGYYYRLFVKREDVLPSEYVSWLLGIYENFLHEVPISSCAVALKGVNLTVFTSAEFFSSYVVRIIGGPDAEESERKALARILLTEDMQNAMHLQFNAGVQEMAARRDFRYLDVNSHIAANPLSQHSSKRLSDAFQPAEFDHHLVDSLAVRRFHLDEMLRAFNQK